MTHSEKAAKFRQLGFNCAQSVLGAFVHEYGIPEDDCFKIACAFGSGMGRQQYTCGAVTGALMVLGLQYGMGKDDPAEKKSHTYVRTQEFFEEFRKINGTLNCRELLDGLDMQDPVEYQMIVDQGMFVHRCNKYVQDAVEILERMMED